jgi:CubicO group peptidase (beta-lactamase class C family)
LFAQWDRTDSPGAAVVIVKDGAVLYQNGYGYANLDHHIPITPQTLFDVASVAKQFTGLSVAMLVQQGKLSLDDDIRKYQPDVPDFGKPITIRNLLHHTSGLRDWPETLGFSGLDMEGPITLDTILEMVRRQRELDFAPGEEHLYSNTGYNLLAAAVAKVTGQSFRAWTDANLFRPLGMKRTLVCDNSAEVVANCADSYAPGDQRKFHRVNSQLSAQGSSSLFITAEDMGKWLLNFETARVGGKTVIEMMHEPGKLNGGAKVDYGFGVALGDYHGSPKISHTGGWAAYRSVVLRVPEKRFAVAILSNAGNMDTHGLALKIADLYLGLPPIKPLDQSRFKPSAAVKVDPATWDGFLGTYRLGPGWLLTITRESDQLMAQETREDKFKMTPMSDRNFFVEAYGAAVEFVRENSGPVTHLLYRGINAPKLNPPELTPALLAAYIGDYWSEELRVAGRLEIHDGKLASQQRSGTWIHFLPTGADRFDAEDGRMALEFTRSPDSGMTEVKVSGGRVRNIRYTRVMLPKGL